MLTTNIAPKQDKQLTSLKRFATPHTKTYLVHTCTAVVITGLRTNPSREWTTSMMAKLCTMAVWYPTLAYVVVALLSTGMRTGGSKASTSFTLKYFLLAAGR